MSMRKQSVTPLSSLIASLKKRGGRNRPPLDATREWIRSVLGRGAVRDLVAGVAGDPVVAERGDGAAADVDAVGGVVAHRVVLNAQRSVDHEDAERILGDVIVGGDDVAVLHDQTAL